MREKKFRIWSNKYNKYLEPYTYPYGHSDLWLKCENGSVCDLQGNYDYDSGVSLEELEIENIVIEQYTGYKKWCENDIIKTIHFKDAKGKQNFLYHQIVWSEKHFCLYAMNCGNEHGFNESDNGNIPLWVFIKNADNPQITGTIHG